MNFYPMKLSLSWVCPSVITALLISWFIGRVQLKALTQQRVPISCLWTMRPQQGLVLWILLRYQGFWKKIWGLKVPNKVKHFVWRARNEALPSKKNLFHRNVTKSAICGGWHSELEDTIHALLQSQLSLLVTLREPRPPNW